jgi:hypothetical protein
VGFGLFLDCSYKEAKEVIKKRKELLESRLRKYELRF